MKYVKNSDSIFIKVGGRAREPAARLFNVG